LYAIIGNAYGGTGNTNFNLPHMGGRVPVGTGQLVGDNTAPSSVTVLAQKGGASNNQLTVANLPPHNHAATFTSSGPSSVGVTVAVGTSSGAAMVNPTPGGTTYLTSVEANTDGGDGVKINGLYTSAAPSGTTAQLGGVTVTGGVSGGAVAVGVTGSGTAFSNLQPYLGVSFIIALQGIWPSRD
jgi:microcystin-dependent protein